MTWAAGASSHLLPNSSSITKRRIRQKLSHRGLLKDVSALTPAVGRRRQVPLNAIIVPSARRAGHLEQAVQLAVQSSTLLVVLASRDSRADDVASVVASTPGCRALVVEVPADYGHEYFGHETSHRDFRSVNANRQSDLSLKRNIGLILARLLGWHKIMYLDDDVYGISPGHLTKMSAQLDNHQVAGLVTRNFPDNSVVCHANRLSGANQDNFVTGAALGVNCADQPLPFFPNIYNEDWFFFIKHAAKGSFPCVGQARQLEYKPFRDPQRAAREEFGDLLAEGLYALIGSGGDPSCTTKNYWDRFADARQCLFDEISDRLEMIDTNEANQALSSIHAARDQASRITSEHCLTFLEAWREDRRRFQAIAAKTANVGTYPAAFDILELKHWRSAEFANPDVSRTPAPLPTRSRATGRRSAATAAPRRDQRGWVELAVHP